MRTLLCLLLVALPTIAADDDKDYYPLNIGTKWTYKLDGQDGKYVVTALAEEKVGHIGCMKLEARLKDQVVATEHIALQKDGFYRCKFNDLVIEPAICVCKLGVKKGDTWQQDFRIGETKVNVRCEADFADVKVSAGEFKNALVIKTVATEKVNADGNESDQITRTILWFVKGKGMVKQTIDLGDGKKVTLDLESIAASKK